MKRKKIILQEWQRTVILFALLGVGVGMVLWSNSNVDDNFIDQFQTPPSVTDVNQPLPESSPALQP